MAISQNEENVVITFKKVDYKIPINRLLCIFRSLKNNPEIKFVSKEQIVKLFDECRLYDELFLKNLSRVSQ